MPTSLWVGMVGLPVGSYAWTAPVDGMGQLAEANQKMMGNAELAEVLNWIVLEFGAQSVAEPFLRYTAAEVGELRKSPLNEVERYRGELIATMASSGRIGAEASR